MENKIRNRINSWKCNDPIEPKKTKVPDEMGDRSNYVNDTGRVLGNTMIAWCICEIPLILALAIALLNGNIPNLAAMVILCSLYKLRFKPNFNLSDN